METKQFAEQHHVHHWVIEEANGPVSHGHCKKCKATREFKNWLESTDFITNEEQRQAVAA